jgi:DNA-directed RNA polymerase alpha subunit
MAEWHIYENYPLAQLGLSTRTLNALTRKRITTVGEAANLRVRELLDIRGMGVTSAADLIVKADMFLNAGLSVVTRLESAEREIALLKDTIMHDAGLRKAYLEAQEVATAMESVKKEDKDEQG